MHNTFLNDAISRFQVTPALLNRYGMRPIQTQIPQTLLPQNLNLPL